MFHRPIKPCKTRSSGGGFNRSQPPPSSRSFSRGIEASMMLEGINSSNSSMTLGHANSSFRKTKKKPLPPGVKRLVNQTNGFIAMLPALSVSRITKFFPTNRSSSQIHANSGVSIESDGEDEVEAVKDCFVADLPEVIEKGRITYSRKISKREFTPSKTANGSFEAVPSNQSSFVELSSSKFELYPNIKTILQDLPSEAEDRGGLDSRGLDSRGQTRGRDTYNQFIMSRTNSMLSKRPTTPGTIIELHSSNVRTIVQSRENSANGGRDEFTHQPEMSATGFKILGLSDSRSGKWYYDSAAATPLSNINTLLADRPEMTDVRPQQTRSGFMAGKRREKSSDKELKSDHKENFMKMIYKGIGRNLQNHQLEEGFLMNMERNRVHFRKKIRAMK